MRTCSAFLGATALIVVLAACGSASTSDNGASVRPPVKVAALGPFAGECGNVTDDEVRDLGGLGQITQVFKNSVGCNWQGAGIDGATVTFASYRGSPIGRERAWVTVEGRNPEAIQVAGRSGFQDVDVTGGICDLAVQLGDDDFFEWSTSAGLSGAREASPCDKNRKLAELTVQRLK